MPPPRIAVVGAPNVGKSTLFNRLARRRRSLVADEPGLTRDLIEAPATLGGIRVTLVDTGGLMPSGDAALGAEILRRVLAAARTCDLLLFVVDSRRGLTPLDEELGRMFRESGRPVILVVNKVDGPKLEVAASDFARLGFDEPICVSAEHGLGVGELGEEVGRRLPHPAEEEESGGEITVAIAGRPNVGKSSILNALLKEERALVSEVPGTTRDPVDAVLVKEGKRFRFVDTAGLRRRGRVEPGAEALSAGASRRAVRDADVTLVLLDASEGLVLQDMHVLGMVAGATGASIRPAVVLLNKIDLLKDLARIQELTRQVHERLRFARFAPVIPVSALKRLHLDRVLQAIETVHTEAGRVHTDSQLNDWLRAAVDRHPPPHRSGKPLSFVFISQARARPPTFTILTNREVRPHFSYARYLENSLRERFGLRMTPLILRFRKKSPRKSAPRAASKGGRGKTPSN